MIIDVVACKDDVMECKEQEWVIEYGAKVWRNAEGQLHRIDGPAIEMSSGIKSWFLHGKRHRESGPAVEYANGTKEWYVNGECHRDDGPAVEHANGVKEWWLNDKMTDYEPSPSF